MSNFLPGAVLAMVLFAGKAAGAGLVDTTFDAGNRFKDSWGVGVVAAQVDGKALASYEDFNTNSPKVTRFLATGKGDPTFKSELGAFGRVRSLATLPDGRLLAGGDFAGRFAMLDADGGRNDTYLLGKGAGATGAVNGSVNAILPRPDGKVIIGGIFTTVGAVSRSGIARLNADGSVDEGFDPGAGLSRPSGFVEDIKVVAADTVSKKLYVAGIFTLFDGQPRKCVARLNEDGSLDESFICSLEPSRLGAPTWVMSMAVQKDGKVILGGVISAVSSVPAFNIARINRDGTLDTAFNQRLSKIPGLDVRGNSLLVLKDGKILISAKATYQDKKTATGLARLNPDGSLDQSFPRGNSEGGFEDMAMDKSGKVVLGGNFTVVDGKVRYGVARVLPNGAVMYTIRVKSASASKGSVKGDTKVALGSYVTVTAKPKIGSKFVCWKQGTAVASRNPVYRFKATQDRLMVAYFE